MRLDPDLVRQILLDIEAYPAQPESHMGVNYFRVTHEGKSEAEMSEHVRCMREGGLIDAHREPVNNSYQWFPVRITWNGHEYLAKIKSDTIYEKTKEIATHSFGQVTIETIKAALPLAMQWLLKSHGLSV